MSEEWLNQAPNQFELDQTDSEVRRLLWLVLHGETITSKYCAIRQIAGLVLVGKDILDDPSSFRHAAARCLMNILGLNFDVMYYELSAIDRALVNPPANADHPAQVLPGTVMRVEEYIRQHFPEEVSQEDPFENYMLDRPPGR